MAGRVDCVGVKPAGERLSGFTEAGMDAAEAGRIKEDAGAIGLVIDSPGGSMGHEERPIGGDAVLNRPALGFDPSFFCCRDPDQVFPAATATVVAGPVLEDREEQAWSWHGAARRSKKALE